MKIQIEIVMVKCLLIYKIRALFKTENFAENILLPLAMTYLKLKPLKIFIELKFAGGYKIQNQSAYIYLYKRVTREVSRLSSRWEPC